MSAHRLRHTIALGIFTAFLSVAPAPASGQTLSCDEVGKYLPREPAVTGYQPGSARSNFVGGDGHYEWKTLVDGVDAPAFLAGSLSGAPQLDPFNSACWATMNPLGAGPGTGVRVGLPPQLPVGARLGINLLAAPKPGDFLCPAATVGESSLCLLPPGAGGVRTSWQGATRPTLEGVVDLVTGVPLVQVNRATVESPAYEDPLTPADPAIVVGDLVKQYCYDGLGRLIRTLSPYPEPGTDSGMVRTERFYYDGIRRIQEVVSNPVASIAYADGSNDPLLVGLSNQTVDPGQDPAGTPLAFEQAQDDQELITPFLEREYVWGPGGVDELLAQFDANRKAWYAVCDDGGDVVALCDPRPAGHSEAMVVSQVTYDAYGEPLTVEHFAPHPYLHCGHKGLFVDRLDVGVVTSGGYETARLAPSATLLCHNRNRSYMPGIGRFLQAD